MEVKLPYKDKVAQKNYNKERMRKARVAQMGSTTVGNTTTGSTEYPALLYALADIKKRAKLRSICQSLHNHRVLQEVRYGVNGPTLDIVAEFLTAF